MTGGIPGTTIHWGITNSGNGSGFVCPEAANFWGAEEYSGVVLLYSLCVSILLPRHLLLATSDDQAWLSFYLCLFCVVSHPYSVADISCCTLVAMMAAELKTSPISLLRLFPPQTWHPASIKSLNWAHTFFLSKSGFSLAIRETEFGQYIEIKTRKMPRSNRAQRLCYLSP